MVEFAILMPLLVLLILGIIEFGWLFGQFNAIRHGAREGARLAAVNGGDASTIRGRVCQTIEGQGSGVSNLAVGLAKGGGAKGDDASIVVAADVRELTNLPLISVFLPDSVRATVQFRLEEDATWVDEGDLDSDGVPDTTVAVPPC